MAKASKVRKRAKAVRSIRDVTKTIEMVASVRFQQTHRVAVAARPFSRHLSNLVAEIAAQGGGAIEHPLLKQNDSPREALLVIAGNRGLCGGHNGAILRAAALAREALLKEGRQVDLHVAGRKAVEFFRFRKIAMAGRHTLAEIPDYQQVQALAQEFMTAFLAGRIRGLKVAYTRFVSAGQQYPDVATLLPIAGIAPEEEAPAPHAGGGIEMHPSPDRLLEALLPATVRVRLYQCCLDSVVSEQIARIAAMRAASDNANDMMKDLTRQYNRLRQAKITTELTEIVGGQAGLD